MTDNDAMRDRYTDALNRRLHPDQCPTCEYPHPPLTPMMALCDLAQISVRLDDTWIVFLDSLPAWIRQSIVPLRARVMRRNDRMRHFMAGDRAYSPRFVLSCGGHCVYRMRDGDIRCECGQRFIGPLALSAWSGHFFAATR